MTDAERLCLSIRQAPACLVTVDSAQGSVPREVGAWMALPAGGGAPIGSIGGGHLEWQALAEAQQRLAEHLAGRPARPALRRRALGPALGQCCGGTVVLRFECVGADDAPALAARLAPQRRPLALFGGGHVGRALERVLRPLPFALHWIDSRDGVFPEDLPAAVHCEHSEPVQGAVPTLAAGSMVLVMSFSHAEDLDIVAACLARQRARADLPFIGLIGSRTKWARFRHRLEARGFAPEELAQVGCPIGVPGIHGKQPEVIAVAVAAQLLMQPPRPSPAKRQKNG